MTTLRTYSLIVLALCVYGGGGLVHAKEGAPDAKPAPQAVKPTDQKSTHEDGLQLLTIPDEELLSAVPKFTHIILNYCPACRKGKPHDKKFDGGSVAFPGEWDPKHPDQIICKACGTVFPNKDFPMKEEIFTNKIGEEYTIRSYRDENGPPYVGQPEGMPKGRVYYIDGMINKAKGEWLFPKLVALSALYKQSGDKRYADKLLPVLDKYLDAYPHYMTVTERGNRIVNWTNRQALTLERFLDRIGDTRADTPPFLWKVLENMAAGSEKNSAKTEDKTQVAIQRMLDKAYKDIYFFDAKKNFLDQELYAGNFGQGLGGLGKLPIATLFKRPEIFHFIVQTLMDTPRVPYFYDGGYVEGPGYGEIQTSRLQGMHVMDGYSDPKGFVFEADGTRFDNVHPMKDHEDFYWSAYNFWKDLRLPGAGNIVTHDCDYKSFILNDTWFKPRERSENIMMGGFKHTVLGDGEGDLQIQTHFAFGDNGANHARQDAMSLQMYAFDHYLLDDFPYHKSTIRKLDELSLVHNTVVINQQNQYRYFNDGDAQLYVPTLPGLSVVKVDGKRAYPLEAKKHIRTLISNTVDLKRPYVVDIFETEGGVLHDYTLRTSSYHPQTAEISLPVKAVPGDQPLMARGEIWENPWENRSPVGTGYGLLFHVKDAEAQPYFTLKYDCTNPWVKVPEDRTGIPQLPHVFDPNFTKANPAVGTMHHFVSEPGYQALLTDMPALRLSGFYGELDPQTHQQVPYKDWQHMQPLFILRHKVAEGEKSLFIVVHEPYLEQPKIKKVERLKTDDANILALRIEFGDRKDTLIYSLDGSVIHTTVDGTELNGVLGSVAETSDGKRDGYLIGGTALKCVRASLALAAPLDSYKGKITGTLRKWNGDKEDALIANSDCNLPEGIVLRGSWIMLKNSGAYNKEPDGSFKAGRPNRMAYDNLPTRMDFNNRKLKLAVTDDSKEYYKKELDRIEAERAYDAQQGDGFWSCFEIDRVEKTGGKVVIVTKGEHGLEIKDGKISEYFFPQRVIENGQTEFVVHTAVSNQGNPILNPRGGAFMEPQRVNCSSSAPEAKLMFSFATKTAAGTAKPNWQSYSKPVEISSDGRLSVKSVSPNGIKDCRVYDYDYTFPRPPDVASNAGLQAGISCRLGSSQPAFILGEIGIRPYAEAQHLTKAEQFVVDGVVEIKQPGIYTFYFLAKEDGSMKLGGQELFPMGESHPLIGVPYSRTVALLKGYYSLHIEQNDPLRKKLLELDWTGPGITRQPIPASQLFHHQNK